MANLDEMVAQLKIVEKKYNLACHQLLCLTSTINRLQTRFDRAKERRQRGHRYNIKMKIVVVQGIRTNFIEYCTRLAFRIEHIERDIRMCGLQERMTNLNMTQAL